MNNNWNVRRKEPRIAVSMPVQVEIKSDDELVIFMESVAENFSRTGFRLLAGESEDLLDGLQVDKPYRCRLTFGRKEVRATIAVVWRQEHRCGFRIIERETGWVVN